MNIFKIGLALCVVLLVSACTKEGKYIARDTTVTEISRTLVDFAGINGYRITYANEREGAASYRIYIGTTSRMMPGEIETVYEGNLQAQTDRSEQENGDINRRLDTRNYRKVRTTERPPEEVITNWNFSIKLSQEGKDVRMYAKASGGFNPIKHVKAFFKLLKFQGIQVKKV
jgi:predicted small secreted protein